jgi:hypothetical protein
MHAEPDDDVPDVTGPYETDDDEIDQCPMTGFQ